MRRRSRLIASLGIALVLATFMLYTALAGGDVQLKVYDTRQLAAQHVKIVATGKPVELVGTAAGPVRGTPGEHMRFYVTDRAGHHRTLVDYRGSVPDAFKVGRQVVVKGEPAGSADSPTFHAQRGSLQTKCPSRFQTGSGKAAS